VFSGAQDPEWSIRTDSKAGKAMEKMIKQVTASKHTSEQAPKHSNSMGYRGFVISCIGERQGVLVHAWKSLEKLLLASAGPHVVSTSVRNHVLPLLGSRFSHASSAASLERVLDWPDWNLERKWAPLTRGNASSNDACDNPPVVGPDSPPIYDPDTDDDGCFIEQQDSNNCYAYGTDIVTNTFPQPGRGSGQKWTQNTCEDMGAAAQRDGLVYYGTTLPAAGAEGQPTDGHYVALLIWPDTNFHWIRRDNATGDYWSHKPGGTEVRNVDNEGNLITDPSKQDFSPWTQFCAYYIAVPTVLKIN
jgi:hypothetical protein